MFSTSLIVLGLWPRWPLWDVSVNSERTPWTWSQRVRLERNWRTSGRKMTLSRRTPGCSSPITLSPGHPSSLSLVRPFIFHFECDETWIVKLKPNGDTGDRYRVKLNRYTIHAFFTYQQEFNEACSAFEWVFFGGEGGFFKKEGSMRGKEMA